MARKWKDFMEDLSRSAKVAGQAHVRTLDALREHYRNMGRELAEERRKLGISQEALASATGVDQAEISRIERDVVDPRLGTYVRLLEGMGLVLRVDRPAVSVAFRHSRSQGGHPLHPRVGGQAAPAGDDARVREGQAGRDSNRNANLPRYASPLRLARRHHLRGMRATPIVGRRAQRDRVWNTAELGPEAAPAHGGLRCEGHRQGEARTGGERHADVRALRDVPQRRHPAVVGDARLRLDLHTHRRCVVRTDQRDLIAILTGVPAGDRNHRSRGRLLIPRVGTGNKPGEGKPDEEELRCPHDDGSLKRFEPSNPANEANARQ